VCALEQGVKSVIFCYSSKWEECTRGKIVVDIACELIYVVTIPSTVVSISTARFNG